MKTESDENSGEFHRERPGIDGRPYARTRPSTALHRRRLVAFWGGGAAALALAVSLVEGQTFSDANWISMGGIPGANGSVLAAVVDDSGNLYIGGSFTLAGDVIANHIAKWDGNRWSALGAGMDSNVLALAVSGNELYAGGVFTTAGGVPANSIARWDGTNWTTLGSGMEGGDYQSVSALAVSGDDLYAGGAFTMAGGVSANRIAKWNGSSWSALGSGILGYPVGYPYYVGSVSALAVSGSDLYAGGHFTVAGGVSATNIAKWNGTSWSAVGLGIGDRDFYDWGTKRSFVYFVTALAVSGSDLYAGGQFTTASGVAATNIAKWNGSSWSALGSGIGGPVGSPYSHYGGSSVSALAVSGSDLYAGGVFTTADGVSAANITKWNGSSWGALGSGINDTGAYPNYGGFVLALAVSGSDLYAGGGFTTAGGKVSTYLARAVLGEAPGYNQLTGMLLSGGALQFSYTGDPGTDYALDCAYDLAAPIQWVGQQTNAMTISGVLLFTNTPVPGTNNFWRVRSVQ